MTPHQVSKQVVLARLDWVQRMVAEIESLPLADSDLFFADSRLYVIHNKKPLCR